MTDTISVTEVLWTLLCLSGVVHHLRVWKAINRDIERLARWTPPLSDGARTLFRRDRETELDFAVFFALLSLAGFAAMFRENSPSSPARWIVIAALFSAIAYVRYRNHRRGQERKDVKQHLSREQDV